MGYELEDATGTKIKIVDIWLNLWSGKARHYLKYEFELPNGEHGIEENSVEMFFDTKGLRSRT